MWGTNEIVGKKYFNSSDNKLLVTSIFHTLQGEGPFSGHKAIFIRLAKCNLACDFCDAYFDTGTWFTAQEVHNKILELKQKHNTNLVVITGGEPFLQLKALESLLHMFRNNIYTKFQIETNGIIDFSKFYNIRMSTIVVSPKSANGKTLAKPHKNNYNYINHFKFIVTADENSPYNEIPKWYCDTYSYHPNYDYVSPMNVYLKEPQQVLLAKKLNKDTDINTRSEEMERISFWEPGLLDMEANKRNHEYAAKLCLENDNFILSLQQHLYVNLP